MGRVSDLVAAAKAQAVGHLLEIRTRSDIMLVDRTNSEDPMAQVWRDIAQTIGPIYHYRGLGSYIVTRDSVGSYKLAVNSVNDSELRLLAGKDVVKHLTKYILEAKRFDCEPRLVVKQYLYYDNGDLRDDITDTTMHASIFQSRAQIDRGNGIITVFAPYPQPEENNNAEIDRLLHIILGPKDQVFKMFLAQMLFEERTSIGGRPSLIMWGPRNAGKGFLVETFVRSLLPQMCAPIPKDWEKFNNFQQYKFLYLDENESDDLDLKKIYILAKRLSGGKIDYVGGKYQEKQQMCMGNYFCAISNDKPIHMSDVPTSDRDNQWLAIKFTEKLDGKREFLEFREKHGADLKEFLRRSAGLYIRDTLLPLYIKFAPEYKKTHRYGFPVPVDADLRELCEMAETQGDTAFWAIMSDLESMSDDQFLNVVEGRKHPVTLLQHFQKYHQSGFISHNLLSFMLEMRGNKHDLTAKKVRDIISKAKIKQAGSEYASISGTTFRGIKIDKEAYRKLMKQGLDEDMKTVELKFDPDKPIATDDVKDPDADDLW